ncbi:polysaccharide deacetylase family protein [Maribrevibacterium harenarium]|nr:polysaccharide deacetylase family protein [Maribrevibacterium harenarium]
MLKKLSVAGLCATAINASAQDYLPILQYHHVSDNAPFSTSVTPAQFTEHMDYLRDANFQVLPLAQALADIRAGKPLPDKAVAITFDDAYRNIYEQGFPILKERGFPFTVFINTGPVEQGNKSFLTWDQMREMQRFGGEFANHTVGHPYLLRLEQGETVEAWWSRITHEIEQVETALTTQLGESPKMLAYPYGESDAQIQEYVTDRGIIGFGQQSGVVYQGSDFANLPRFPAAGHYAKLATLKTKLNAKPMPLIDTQVGGLYAGQEPVSMTMQFDKTGYRFKELACYVSGQNQAELIWLDELTVKVVAERPFRAGRSRINCTMPDKTGRHYYWFSNVWIKPKGDEGYVSEKNEKF